MLSKLFSQHAKTITKYLCNIRLPVLPIILTCY